MGEKNRQSESGNQPVKPDCGCGGSCGGELPRREFLKLAGVGAMACAPVHNARTILAALLAQQADIQHHVPADKKLSADWIKSLYAKGATAVYRGKDLATVGMPIGGIGAGQLYLCGDGTLGCWQVFNGNYFAGVGETSYQYRTPGKELQQGFAVITQAGEQSKVRKLSSAGFADVAFTGEYPIANVQYNDPASPVRVHLEAFSPFIPLNARDSGLPATMLTFTVENTSQQSVRAGILGWLENGVCFHNAERARGLRRSRIVQERDRTLIVHSAEPLGEAASAPAPRAPIVLADFEGQDYGTWRAAGEALGSKPAEGTLPGQQPVGGFQGKGLVNTFFNGDATQGTLTSAPFAIERKFINFLLGGGDHPELTCVNLLIDGKIARSTTGTNQEQLRWRTWNVEEFAGKLAVIEIVDHHSGPWGHINIDQIEQADESREAATGPIDTLYDFGTMALACSETAAPFAEVNALLAAAGGLDVPFSMEPNASFPLNQKRAAAACSPMAEIAPGGKRQFTFVLAWHFPNQVFADQVVGHAYAAWLADASAVAHYVLDNRERLAGHTRLWHDTYYDSTLPHWLLDRLFFPVANLATNTTQWRKNGQFWAWEGVCCCEGTCTHVWNYAHAAARLFPQLERSVRHMQDLGDAFHEDGLVGFRGQRNQAYAADGQAGTILKCYREHLCSPDAEFLKNHWPKIKQALLFSIGRDANDDGLIEDSQHNTYDINFEGPNTFVGSLYLAALKAGEAMAREVGDAEFADRCKKIFEAGSKLSVDRLWNGEYFIQQVDLRKFPKHQYGPGCLSDQVFGQGWAHHVALGYIYPADHVKRALQSVWKYNWAPDVGPQNAVHKPGRCFASPTEAGLFTCTWPHSKHLDEGVLYQNEIWTGIEYQVAGHMVWEGMLDEAMVIIRGIHDRYHPAKHNPYNEVECGDHYARALASWGVLTALSGFEYHGPRGQLAFAPRISPENFRSAFTTAQGWGTFSQQREAASHRNILALSWGQLRLTRFTVQVPDTISASRAKLTVLANGQPLDPDKTIKGPKLTLRFKEPVQLAAGQSLDISVVG